MAYEVRPTSLEDLTRDGYLRKVTNGDLVLFNYTDKTTFERAWQTKYTLHSRGLILNKNTGEVVAKCFPKILQPWGNGNSISFKFAKRTIPSF